MPVLSIQSHVAMGHIGNSAAVFALQRLGIEVWPVHTVQLSNHTGFADWGGGAMDVAHVADVLAGLERRGAYTKADAILTGYMEAPDGVTLAEGMSYNPYFAGHNIAMGPPIDDEAVDYIDGTKNSKEQIAHDVVSFLAWAAEPTLEARKRLGVKVILYLIVLTLVLYGVKRKVWAKLH